MSYPAWVEGLGKYDNRVSFSFSWAAQPGTLGPTLLGAGFLYCILSPTGLVSKLTDFLSSPSYIINQRPPSSCGHHKLHLFNPSTVKATLCHSSTRCTCYLHRCISYFDSRTGCRSICNKVKVVQSNILKF